MLQETKSWAGAESEWYLVHCYATIRLAKALKARMFQHKETAHTTNALFLAGTEYIPYTESGLTQVLREGMGL